MAAPRRPSARPVLTGRALVLGGLIVLFVVLLASPVHRYLASRSDVSQADRQLRHDRSQLANLTRQRDEWSDPGYIQAQARTRLQYAMPGDTVYVVVHQGQRSAIEKTAGSKSHKAPSPGWNTRLWDTVRDAGK